MMCDNNALIMAVRKNADAEIARRRAAGEPLNFAGDPGKPPVYSPMAGAGSAAATAPYRTQTGEIIDEAAVAATTPEVKARVEQGRRAQRRRQQSLLGSYGRQPALSQYNRDTLG